VADSSSRIPSVETPDGACVLTLAGMTAVLLPERALFLPALDTLLVADLHWGKAAAFRAANVPVPTGTTATDLSRLSQALLRTRASHLVVLGDLLHARHGRHADTMATIAEWRRAYAALQITLVRGNHDIHAGDPPEALAITCTPRLQLGPFIGLHEPQSRPDGYVLAGHLHPHVRLSGRGSQHLRLPCFVFGDTVGILPAFSSFTGRGMYDQVDTDRLYAIVDDAVVAIPSSSRRTR
jgi:uncharacterized protein